ncbi:MAG: family 16 glycosylhydrolase [Bacteroidota bacterium]
MKHKYLAILVFLLSCVTRANSQNWPLVWADEFNGTKLDTLKWNIEVNDWGGGNNELQYYTSRPENIAVNNGTLKIIARKENYQGKPYTSGRICNGGPGSYRYGRIESKIKVPTGQGTWAAFWMLPTEAEYGGWPKSGEIDIMEILGGSSNITHATLHYGMNTHEQAGEQRNLGVSASAAFHIYACEWRPGSLKFFCDNALIVDQPFDKPFDKRFHVLLNLAIGGDWPGAVSGTTAFPCSMEVDYVRMYADSMPAAREPDSVGTARVNGLNYSLYSNYNNLWQLPGFYDNSTNNKGVIADLTIPAAAGTNNFYIWYDGWFEATGSGLYGFYSKSSDGSKVMIGDSTIVFNDYLHPALERRGKIWLKKGLHRFRAGFFSKSNSRFLSIAYTGPGQNRGIAIPSRLLWRLANKAPTCTMQLPGNNALIAPNSRNTLRASCTDDGAIREVDYYLNRLLVGSQIDAPREVNWANAQPGYYELYARAFDATNLQTKSPTIKFAVTNTNLSRLPTARFTASSYGGINTPASAADGNAATFWQAFGENQWLRVDFGASCHVWQFNINWQDANTRRAYQIQSSTNGTAWTDVVYETYNYNSTSVYTVNVSNVRYIRILVGNPYIEEFNIYGALVSSYGSDQNIALLPQVVASADNIGAGAADIVRDDNPGSSRIFPSAGTRFISYDLNGQFNISSFIVTAPAGHIPSSYRIQYSGTGQGQWVDAFIRSGNILTYDTTKLSLTSVRYIRLLVTALEASQIGEFKVYGQRLNVVGIEDDIEQPKFEIYPNPSSDYITFGGAKTDIVRYTITDMAGRTLQDLSVPADKRIPVSDLPVGNYMLRLFDNKNLLYSKPGMFAVK